MPQRLRTARGGRKYPFNVALTRDRAANVAARTRYVAADQHHNAAQQRDCQYDPGAMACGAFTVESASCTTLPTA